MSSVRLELPRFLLRDFVEQDRNAFRACQADPRYCRLYDFDPADVGRADRLFDLFRAWQRARPRENFHLGIFERGSGRLCGNAGLRRAGAEEAVFGIELRPDDWGRFRLALDVSAVLLGFGFRELRLSSIRGETSSGNGAVEKLARRFGARIVERRAGPRWMQDRGSDEVEWRLARQDWAAALPPHGA